MLQVNAVLAPLHTLLVIDLQLWLDVQNDCDGLQQMFQHGGL